MKVSRIFKSKEKKETPQVYISIEAHQKIQAVVDICDSEVAWIGSVEKEGNKYIIEDIFLYKQEVSSAEANLDGDALLDLMESLTEGLAEEEAERFEQKMAFWGHSHPGMSVTPSKQDNDQMVEGFIPNCPWFLRGIFNKKGEYHLSFYDYQADTKYADLQYVIINPCYSGLRKEMEAEVKEKVTVKSEFYSGGEWINGTFVKHKKNNVFNDDDWEKGKDGTWRKTYQDPGLKAIEEKYIEEFSILNAEWMRDKTYTYQELQIEERILSSLKAKEIEDYNDAKRAQENKGPNAEKKENAEKRGKRAIVEQKSANSRKNLPIKYNDTPGKKKEPDITGKNPNKNLKLIN